MSETNNAEAPQGPMLNIADIQNVIRVIDYACDQGAFKGWTTIEQVLLVRNRLNDFVLAVSPPEESKPEEVEAEVATEAPAARPRAPRRVAKA